MINLAEIVVEDGKFKRRVIDRCPDGSGFYSFEDLTDEEGRDLGLALDDLTRRLWGDKFGGYIVNYRRDGDRK